MFADEAQQWIPAFAGMTNRVIDIPANAGIHVQPDRNRSITPTLH